MPTLQKSSFDIKGAIEEYYFGVQHRILLFKGRATEHS
jgi:hypothetical protein